MSNCDISVCMAVYNGALYIHPQIKSILSQLPLSSELIVSDDGSSDLTLSIVRSFNDPRIRICQNQGNKGYSNNFENALGLARGTYIFLSDQDDIWVDGKVDKMILALSYSDLVVSNAEYVDQNLQSLGINLFGLRGGKQGLINNFIKSRYLGACMAFRNEMLEVLLPFPSNKKLCPHDFWISIVGEACYKVILISEPLILYRRHGKNASSGGGASANSLLEKIVYRIYAMSCLISRCFQMKFRKSY